MMKTMKEMPQMLMKTSKFLALAMLALITVGAVASNNGPTLRVSSLELEGEGHERRVALERAAQPLGLLAVDGQLRLQPAEQPLQLLLGGGRALALVAQRRLGVVVPRVHLGAPERRLPPSWPRTGGMTL